MADAALKTPVLDRAHLRADAAGFALLGERLREANTTNPESSTLYQRLTEVSNNLLRRLDDEFPGQIERVVASGDWARYGFDLRNMPFEDLSVEIVFDLPDRPFGLYTQVAERVLLDLDDRDVFVQFGLITSAEWRRMAEAARSQGVIEALGIPIAARS